MKKILKTIKKKTTSTLKCVYNTYSRNFMEFYGPTIKSGVNPFI